MKKAIIITGVIFFVFFAWFAANYLRPDLSREEVAEYAYSYLELPSGASAHYREMGNPDGPVILLIHGGQGSLRSWNHWIELLDQNYRYITVDMPGHGLTGRIPSDKYTRQSMVDLVHEFLNTMGIDKVIVGGISMGGNVALHFTLQHPEQVEATLLQVSGGIENPNIPWHFKLYANPPFTWLTRWLAKPTYAYMGLDTKDSVEIKPGDMTREEDPSPWTDNDGWFSHIHRYEGNRYAQNLMYWEYIYGDHPVDLEPRFGEITTPTLLQFGELDPLVPVWHAKKFNEGIKGSELLLYKKVAHLLIYEIPKQSADDFMAFLKAHKLDPVSRSVMTEPGL